MGFTHIIFFMAGLFAIGPILAHLLNRAKYRKIPFTMLQFLQVSQKQTESRRKLRDFLILLLRCMIILLIAFLFTGPVIYQSVKEDNSKNMHILVIDNSLSMSCELGSETYFNNMLTMANNYINKNEGSNSIFGLYSTMNECYGSELTAESARILLEKVKIKPGVTDLSLLTNDFQRDITKKYKAVKLHLISDFTDEFIASLSKSFTNAIIEDVSFDIIGFDSDIDNLAITNASVLNQKEGKLTLTASVSNWGEKTEKRLIRADINDTHSNEVFVNPAPGQQEDVILTIDIAGYSNRNNNQPIQIKLLPDDNLIADDIYSLAVSIDHGEDQDILLVGNHSDEMFLIDTALKTLKKSHNSNIENIKVKTFSEFVPGMLYASNIVFFSSIDARLLDYSDALRQYLESGGNCIFFMTKQPDMQTAKTLFASSILPVLPKEAINEVPQIIQADFQLNDISPSDMKTLGVLQHYQMQKTPLWKYYTYQKSPSAVSFWPISANTSLLYRQKYKSGSATLINTSVNDTCSSLTKNASVLPLLSYLIDSGGDIVSRSFSCEETVHVLLNGTIADNELDYIDATDNKHTVVLPESLTTIARIPGPHQIGWLRIMSDPVEYVGIHTNALETKLKRTIDESEIQKTLKVVYPNQKVETSKADNAISKDSKSLSQYIIFVLILLIFLDSFIANRIQRS